jgi:hypothetical protein
VPNRSRARAIGFSTGAGLVPGSKVLYSGRLGGQILRELA